MKRRILLTGIAGFIGSWTAEALLAAGHDVIGIDNFNEYYDVSLKHNRVKKFSDRCPIITVDITDRRALGTLPWDSIDQVCHLAAQAGVGYSLTNPFAFEQANNMGTLNLLELCREKKVKSFVFASSSSVYGSNKKAPFSVTDQANSPISIYGATKKYNELLAHVYHHLYGLHCTGLRFFTVYGPWGRPDMALFKFTKAILAGEPINVFNHGKMKRDFTYISDIVAGILAALDKNYPYEIFNLGNSNTVELSTYIETIEKELGKKAKKNLLPMQSGDVPETFADIGHSREKLGFAPKVSVEQGIKEFIQWYLQYYKVRKS